MLLNRDKAIMWHPFTQQKTAKDMIAIKSAKGSYVYDEKDHGYLDLISSWWVTLHGHGHRAIAKSIYEQAKTLEHVLFAGFTHEPAVSLCEGLQALLPKQLSRFFFSDNGSTAVEVALKMAYQYWRHLGQEKPLFLSFEGGYHGDTFGAMSVGSKSGFHHPFQKLFFECLTIPYPHTWKGDKDIETKEQHALQVLKNHLQKSHKIAAFILEPLVQGASGMRMCRPQFIHDVINLVRDNNILVIFDEVMTGFGRTGTFFALDQLHITPDFLCLSKGLTGGFLPLALTVTSEKIYESFLGDDFQTAFAHGHSYTANPLACRAGLTSLALLQKPRCQRAIKNIHKIHTKELQKLQEMPVEKIRLMGTIAAFDIKNPPMDLRQRFYEKGLLLRPLGKTVYILPPYCMTSQELHKAYESIRDVLHVLT